MNATILHATIRGSLRLSRAFCSSGEGFWAAFLLREGILELLSGFRKNRVLTWRFAEQTG